MNKTIRTATLWMALAAILPIGACAQTRTSESTGEYVDDSAITTKVKTAILQDAQLKVLQIHVATYQDRVQLSGFVDNAQMIARATAVVSNVAGVRSVQNNLIVK